MLIHPAQVVCVVVQHRKDRRVGMHGKVAKILTHDRA